VERSPTALLIDRKETRRGKKKKHAMEILEKARRLAFTFVRERTLAILPESPYTFRKLTSA
jgi:hypothetical protein